MIPKEILKKVRQIEIRTQSIVDSLLCGEYHSAFKGRGMEFAEVRQYTEGDDIRSVDWNVTARMGEPYVKQHIEERELTVMLLVDASASGNFGSSGDKFKSEIGVELSALLAFSAIKNNDQVGLIIFTSRIEKFIPPKKGKKHVLRVIRELLYHKPVHRGTDIGAALSYLNRVQKKRAVVFVISDFLDSRFEQPLRVIGRKHDVIACVLKDPRDARLPSVGLLEVEDPETGETILVNTRSGSLRKRYADAVEKRSITRSRFFRSIGVDEIPLSTETDYVDPLIRFFKRRERIHA